MAGWECVQVSGPEARDFLQRLTTANFKRLTPGQFTPAALLQATGKLIVYFKTLMLADNSYLLLVPPQADGASAAQAAFAALEKLHFRENLTITPRASEWVYLRVLGVDEPPAPPVAPGALEHTTDGEIWFNENRWNLAPYRFDFGLVVPTARVQPAAEELANAGFEPVATLEPYRVRAGDPAWPSELNPGVMPLEAHLDDAVHENKGCYPGQEVIERVRSMGQPPKLLALIRGEGELPPGQAPIMNGDQSVGSLTSAVADPLGSGWVGLGYVKRVALTADAQFAVAGQVVSASVKA